MNNVDVFGDAKHNNVSFEYLFALEDQLKQCEQDTTTQYKIQSIRALKVKIQLLKKRLQKKY